MEFTQKSTQILGEIQFLEGTKNIKEKILIKAIFQKHSLKYDI
jgi:hypothetical protein